MVQTSVYTHSHRTLAGVLEPFVGPSKALSHAKHTIKNMLSPFTVVHGPQDKGPHAIGKNLRQLFEKAGVCLQWLTPLEVDHWVQSPHDHSVKFAIRLGDGSLVETVLIPEEGRLTLCVSSQVGCAQGCRFCHTGRMGLMRSLTTEEIIGQLAVAAQWGQTHGTHWGPITNVVFMGMGEPMDNLGAVAQAVAVMTDDQGLRLSPNKVTVSTVGLLPAVEDFLKMGLCHLALSVHSPFAHERARIVPVEKDHPLEKVLKVLEQHPHRGPFLLQYTLMEGVNDSLDHAQALAQLVANLPVKVNLIPLNEHKRTAFKRPDLTHVMAFRNVLKAAGLVCTVRLSKGRDIEAACGQLIKKRPVGIQRA